MGRTNVKADARRLIDELPEDATWEDLMYRIYVRQAIEAGLDDVAAGHVLALKSGTPGQRYILGGTDLSLREILSLVAA